MAQSSDLSYRLLAARYVRRQVKQLAEQLDGIRKAEDIEFVHRARVASRRIRAALRMFRGCFPRKRVKKWRKQIRRLTRGLGEARDKDVQIEFLSGALRDVTDKASSPGIARLLAQLEHERERVQPEVIRALRRLRAGKTLEWMQAITKSMLADAKEQEIEIYGPAALAETRQHILSRLEEMLPFEDSLLDPEDRQRHHAMRIAAKRLRYTLEIAKPAYRGCLDETIEAIKRVQTLLGDIHDCDVWLDQLQEFAEEERGRVLAHFGGPGRYARLEPGIAYLQSDRDEHRRQVFQDLVEFWQQLRCAELWEKLVRTVEDGEGSSAAVAEATTAVGPAAPAGDGAPKPAETVA